jgi:hypothetical protein
MLDFDTYIDRHGEFGVQAIVERLERYEGIPSYHTDRSLEERWYSLMGGIETQQHMAA